MFCPKCGVQNIEDAKFCRGCGADIGLVPQALTGHLPEKRSPRDEVAENIGKAARRHSQRNPPRLDKAISTGFTGLAFLVVSIVLAFMPMGRFWWYWMLIPAFSMIGGGIAEYVRYKQSIGDDVEPPRTRESVPAIQPPTTRMSALPPRNTSELVQPPSVTEGTTRHLGIRAEAPTRHVNTPAEKSAEDA